MLKFFDCNCQVGRWADPQPEMFTDGDSLVKEMAYNGISDALVYHAMAKELGPAVGNARLHEEIDGHPELHPCWVVMPHYTDEMPEPKKLVDSMIENGVRVARVFPTFQQFRLGEWCCGELFAEFERRQVPVMVEVAQTTGWDEVAGVLASFPQLRLIMLRVEYRCDRYIYALMNKYPNLKVEISYYQTTDGIATMCKKYGADRLLFGTGLPWFNAGTAIPMVTYAEISDDEKQLIAGDNLRNLMQEVIK